MYEAFLPKLSPHNLGSDRPDPVEPNELDLDPTEGTNKLDPFDDIKSEMPPDFDEAVDLMTDAQLVDLSALAADDGVGLYLREISGIPLLTAEEEKEIAQRYDMGRDAQSRLDTEALREEPDPTFDAAPYKRLAEMGLVARDRLTRSNTRLVVSIAKKFMIPGNNMPFLDLIQEGNLGLMKAVEKFDWRRGYKFSTYATWWIRQAITRGIADQSRSIRIPAHMSDKVRRLMNAKSRLERDGLGTSTEAVLAEAGLEMDPREAEDLLKISSRPIELEKPVGDGDDSVVGDFIAGENDAVAVDKMQDQLLWDELRDLILELAPNNRTRTIMTLLYGLDGGRTHTLEEVGEMFGITRERIRQIESKEIRRAKHQRILRGLNR